MFLSGVSAYATEVEPMGPGEGGGGGFCTPHLDVDKFGPRIVKVGDRLTYTIVLENTGTCNLHNIRLVDFLPNRVQFDEADPMEDQVIRCEVQGFDCKVIWNDIDLRVGESETFELTIHVVGPPNRTLVNRACASHPWFSSPVCDIARTNVVTGAEE